LCVAVDAAGNVLVSRDPTRGAGAWTVETVDAGNTISNIACPSTSLCVAGDTQGNILTSTDPTGGSAAWGIGHVDDSSNYGCDQDGGSGPQCAAGPTGISCPTESLCVLVDGSLGEYSSRDPAAGASSWMGRGGGEPLSEGFMGLACPSLELCVGATGYGGQVVTWDPSRRTRYAVPNYQFTTLDSSYSFLLSPACASSAMCFVILAADLT
jgi:hypothetical protein